MVLIIHPGAQWSSHSLKTLRKKKKKHEKPLGVCTFSRVFTASCLKLRRTSTCLVTGDRNSRQRPLMTSRWEMLAMGFMLSVGPLKSLFQLNCNEVLGFMQQTQRLCVLLSAPAASDGETNRSVTEPPRHEREKSSGAGV